MAALKVLRLKTRLSCYQVVLGNNPLLLGRKTCFGRCRNFASKEEGEDLEKPVQFSTSKAADYTLKAQREALGRTNRARHEPLIVSISLICFLIYFCALREESDWDLEISRDLYDRVPDLEIVNLRLKRDNAKNPGAPSFTEADRQRLEELEKARQLS